jgi:hypothetical protein
VPVSAPIGSIVAGHLQHRPVVMAGALGPGPGAHPVPGAGGNLAGSRGCGHGAARADADDVVGPDRRT